MPQRSDKVGTYSLGMPQFPAAGVFEGIHQRLFHAYFFNGDILDSKPALQALEDFAAQIFRCGHALRELLQGI